MNDYLDLLFDISELTDLVTDTTDIDMFLGKAVDLVARHFNAPVCSIYLYNEETDLLTLKATKGLKTEAVNQVHMKPGEGLIGNSFKTLSIIREGNASNNKKFKYFKEAGEEGFNSFLCVPIRRGVEKIGVLAVQHQAMNYFGRSKERTIRAVVTQLAGAIENARLLMVLSQNSDNENAVLPEKNFPVFIKGKAVVSGCTFGPVFTLSERRKGILNTPRDGENRFTKSDFLDAIENTTHELKTLQSQFSKKLPESASLIFTAHFMILKDKNFKGKMITLIDEGTLPCDAVRQVTAKYISIFSSSPHDYMKEKAQDVEDLGIRILNHFFTVSEDHTNPDHDGGIAIARDIYPSDILKFVSAGIKGLILTSGGTTSHVSILARSLQLPLVIAEDPRLHTLDQHTQILLDADQGNIHINPDQATLSLFESRNRSARHLEQAAMTDKTYTHDHVRIKLMANINLLSELSVAKSLKAEGIGLYRTEFPFLIRTAFPSEAEQYIIYKQLLEEIGDVPVTFRTLDAGGEKALAYSPSPGEANPELGLRSIRFSLKHKDIFTFQIRAILRAAADNSCVRIMFPLISSIDEFIDARQVVHTCMTSLTKEQLEFNRKVSIGIMIELPSVLETIDEFARVADFFSIGTNDFVQYMLAADRSNKMVADYYLPCHPAVNRGIKKIVDAAKTHNIDVSVCGEMAHEVEYLPFLLGIGVQALSVDPQFLPMLQTAVNRLSISETSVQAKAILNQTTIKGVRQVMASITAGQ